MFTAFVGGVTFCDFGGGVTVFTGLVGGVTFCGLGGGARVVIDLDGGLPPWVVVPP